MAPHTHITKLNIDHVTHIHQINKVSPDNIANLYDDDSKSKQMKLSFSPRSLSISDQTNCTHTMLL